MLFIGRRGDDMQFKISDRHKYYNHFKIFESKMTAVTKRSSLIQSRTGPVWSSEQSGTVETKCSNVCGPYNMSHKNSFLNQSNDCHDSPGQLSESQIQIFID